jgi:phosphate transport system protein
MTDLKPGTAVRATYTRELERLEEHALGGLELVAESLDRVMEAVQHQDVELASLVIADDDRVDGRYLEVHQGILSMLAREAPVASDLRLITALLAVVNHLERMGDQCVNIAKLIPLAGHRPPAHAEMLEKIADMGRRAGALVDQARVAFGRRDLEMAEDLVVKDEVVNALNRECFYLGLEISDDEDTREWAMHMMLVARWLERLADNAVDIGEQCAFVITGLFREFTDASEPKLASGGSI